VEKQGVQTEFAFTKARGPCADGKAIEGHISFVAAAFPPLFRLGIVFLLMKNSNICALSK
jgi:hypothetical protein